MAPSLELEVHPAGHLDRSMLTYVIIGSRENSNWIFVRHCDRNSWELPAGHIEDHEDAYEAAKRELFEETGVTRSSLKAVCDYTVHGNGHSKSGRIFLASVIERGPLPDSEICEIALSSHSPEPATYPEVHWKFLEILKNHLE